MATIITFLILCARSGFALNVIHVSQNIFSNDNPNCGKKMNPCRTINYPVRFQRFQHSELILMIDGGSNENKPFVYKIQESIQVKFNLTIHKSSPAVPVIRSCLNHFNSNTSIFYITSNKLTINSISFYEFPSLFTSATLNLNITIEDCYFRRFMGLQEISSLKSNLTLNIYKCLFENFKVVFACSLEQRCKIIFQKSDFIGERNKTKKYLLVSNATIWLHQYVFSKFYALKKTIIEKLSLVLCKFLYVLAVFNSIGVHDIEILHSTFSSNQVDNNTHQLQLNYLNGHKKAIISNCLFTNNVYNGGTLTAVGYGKIRIANTIFRNNTGRIGGALFLSSIRNTTAIVNCSFFENKAYDSGGALAVFESSDVFIEDCMFRKNKVDFTAQSYNSFISKTRLYGTGGAIAFQTVIFDIQNSTFEGNTAPLYGGTLGQDSRIRKKVTQFGKRSKILNSVINGTEKKSLMGSLIYLNIPNRHFVEVDNLTLNIFTDFRFQSAVYIKTSLFLRKNLIRVNCPDNYNIGSVIQSRYIYIYCVACDKDTYNLERGSIFIKNSKNKTTKSIECYPCPTGGICDQGIISKDNYWGNENFKKEVKFTECPQLYCCSKYGKKCVSYNTCEKSRTGRLCGECMDGFSESIITTKCIDNKHCGTVLFWIGVSISALAYTIIILYFNELTRLFKCMFKFVLYQFKHMKFLSDLVEETEVENGEMNNNTKSSSAVLKIFIFFYQIEFLLQVKSSMKKSFKVSTFWTDLVSSIFNLKPSTQERSNLQLCAWKGMDAVQKEVAKVAAILCVFVLLFLSYLFFHCFRRIYIIKKRFSTYEPLEFDQEELLIANIDPASIKVDNLMFDVRVKCAFLRLSLMTYIPITSVALKLINCVSIGDLKYLFICGKFECYKNWWQYLTICFLTLWVMPFCLSLYLSTDLLKKSKINPVQFLKTFAFPPLSFFYCYKAYKKNIKNHRSTLTASTDIERLRLLEVFSGPYRPAMSKWIGIVIFRKFILTLVTIFTINPVLRLYLLILLLVIFLMIHNRVQPYKSDSLNWLESISLSILIIFASINLYWAHSFILYLREGSFLYRLGEVFLHIELTVLLIPVLALGVLLLSAFSIFVWRNVINVCCKRKFM